MPYSLEKKLSWLFDKLEEIERLAAEGRLTLLSAKGEVPPNPAFYRDLGHGLHFSLAQAQRDVNEFTVGSFRQFLRTERLHATDKSDKQALAWYSMHLDRVLLLIPHFNAQRSRAARPTRWNLAEDPSPEPDNVPF